MLRPPTKDRVTLSSRSRASRAGEGVDRLAPELLKSPGVSMAAPFGLSLHVSGPDRAALEAGLAPWRRPPFTWTETSPTLEDVFIHLMGQAKDNYQ